MVRILHMPTLHKMVLEAQTQPFELLDNGTKALLLVMCYAAMQSIGAAHCETLFAETASRMEQLCRIAAETAFTRARLIQTRHLQVLQAFTLFLVSHLALLFMHFEYCIYLTRWHQTCSVHTGFSSVWTLVGLAMRIATSLGLHHDGTDFGLSPYEVEMRRRLWWELRLLDYRASEKCGIPASMVVDSTTRMPLNIYDSDFDQTTEAPLKEREEATEMSFSLLRFELSSQLPMLFQTVFNQTSADATGQRQPTGSQVEEKEGRLRELNNYLLRKYKCLFENDPRSPFFRFAAEASRILLTRIRLQIYFETAGRKRSSSPNEVEDSDERSELLGSDHSDELFLLSVTLLERHFRLLLDPETARWKWRVDTCTHWHAVAFVLSELRHRIDLLAKDGLQLPASPMLLPKNIQRAWDVIELIFSEQELGGGFTGTRRESWGPLEKLRQQIQTKLDLPNMPSPSSGLGFDLQPWPEFNLAMQQTDSMAPGAQSFSALDEDISFLWTCPIS